MKTACRGGVELRPVELFLDTVEGVVANLALRAQAQQCRALGRNRAQPQIVIFGRRLRLVLVLGRP